jgi:probable poly-beta-1,6-N-acetyl-D-glucosamine export protein
MLVHLWFIPDRISAVTGTHFIDTIHEILFHDSTIYFLYISGFLLYYLSGGFKVQKYFKNKLSYVVIPYLLITFVLTVQSEAPKLLSGHSRMDESLGVFFSNVVFGKAQVQFWYIPFIIPIFLISPLLLNIPNKIFKYLAIATSFLPLLGTRTTVDLTFGQYMYFLPSYILGMFAAMNYEKTMAAVKRFRIPLCAIAVLSLIFVAWSYHSGHGRLYESSQYVNKISITYLFLFFLKRLEQWRSQLFNAFAEYSFALYFMHGIGEDTLNPMFYGTVLGAFPVLSGKLPLVLLSIFYAIARILITLGICVLIKKVLGRSSRYIMRIGNIREIAISSSQSKG